MAPARQYVEKDFYTEEEYLAWEESAVEKSEYIDGQIRAMSGGSEPHASIPMNIGALLWNGLRGKPCRVLSSDMKVWAAGAFYYPDLSVVCGPSAYRGRNKHTITNPVLVVEVLSPGTESKDRGEKFIRYQQIETLRSYLLVSQTEPRVELFERAENGHWDYTTVAGINSMVAVPSLDIMLALSEIYDQVDLSDAVSE
jgi:Uma2 family endonuclease